MNTPSEREAALRRALLSAAEQIEPSPGGLERIQARLGRPRPMAVAWLEAAWTDLVMRAPVIIDAVRRHAGAVRRHAGSVLRLVVERFGPGVRPGVGPKRLSRLRPLAAMSVAVFVLGAGIYVALASPAAIFQTGGGSPAGPLSGGSSHPGGSGPSGTSTTLSNGSRSASSAAANPSASSSPACAKGLKRYSAPTAPGGQSISPIPPVSSSPPVSPSPTTAGSTTPSTGGSTSPASGDTAASPAVADQTSAAGAMSKKSIESADPVSSARAKDLPGNNSPKYPCGSGKSAHKRHGNASAAAASPDAAGNGQLTLTSAKLAGTQPGRAVAAKLD
jgi:hypothetical protein